MLPERREVLDLLVNGLRTQYDVSNYSGLKQAGLDRGIRVIENTKAWLPFATKDEGRWYVFLSPKSLFLEIKYYALAHELGHAFLDLEPTVPHKIREQEADYLARSLTGIEFSGVELDSKLFVITIQDFLLNPISYARYAVDSHYRNFGYFNMLLEEAKNDKRISG